MPGTVQTRPPEKQLDRSRANHYFERLNIPTLRKSAKDVQIGRHRRLDPPKQPLQFALPGAQTAKSHSAQFHRDSKRT